jgi:RNA polymerase sigma factor (sigma-70 family)
VTDISDRALIEAVVARGDERAFSTLYDRHTPYLYRLALRLCGSETPQAEDLVHDAWVMGARRFASFEHRSSLRTWLAGFVVNGARRSWRADARAGELDREPATEDTDLVHAAERVDLERAIAKLPPRARHVLVLHDVEGWTHEDIARQLGIEEGTSKSQLSRARSLVRRQLEIPETEAG